jgi:hypothetical protein
MRFNQVLRNFAASAVLLGSLVFSPLSQAEMSHSDYLTALKIADQHVQRQKALRAEDGAGALSTSLARELMGRFYQVGDTWDVAAVHVASSMMRRTADPHQLTDRADEVGLFRYEVVEVKNGANPEVIIHVRQLEENGFKVVDKRVEKMVLKASAKLEQSAKSYVYAGQQSVRTGQALAASTVTAMELFPLDVPNVLTAQREKGKAIPALPASLAGAVRNFAYSVQPSSTAWFEQDDFFGRPVQFLWQQGDPWPAYLKTPQGVAVLVRKGGA